MRILVIGPFGQDAHFLLSALSVQQPAIKLYGVNHRESPEKIELFRRFNPSVQIQVNDLTRKSECKAILDTINPHYIFHLAAVHSSVKEMTLLDDKKKAAMWGCHYTITENLVDWITYNKESRLVYAASSQMFAGHKSGASINESSLPFPVNEYGKSKFAGWQVIKEARESRNLHLSCGILFNHTSEFSKPEFLFPSLVEQIVQIIEGNQNVIRVKNEFSFIDISYAGEIALGLIAMAKSKYPGDYILGSGTSNKVSKILEATITHLGLDFNKISIQSTETLSEQLCLVSNSTKANENLGWKAVLSPDQILIKMVRAKTKLKQ
jgi:GDPmannose 4,6-dehydratase